MAGSWYTCRCWCFPWNLQSFLCSFFISLLFRVQAANYLDIKGLLDVTCKTVANMIKGKTPEEIRKTFNIKNDFTEEEEAQVVISSIICLPENKKMVWYTSGGINRFGRFELWQLTSALLSFTGTQREPVVWRKVRCVCGGGNPVNTTTLKRIVPANWLHWRCSYLLIFTFSIFRATYPLFPFPQFLYTNSMSILTCLCDVNLNKEALFCFHTLMLCIPLK